ncbi:hypothetical protein BD311DRAFT_780044 [Dichomitus squalens]|uniref:F-box domain-containing protein n=1 Tax=Dichomitus squalens TaxID=114155 RepID=A0A4Q9MGH7_9APHY|nr:hypothetical protein BD311DRAFT_780044 [Dichomitus squalens]
MKWSTGVLLGVVLKAMQPVYALRFLPAFADLQPTAMFPISLNLGTVVLRRFLFGEDHSTVMSDEVQNACGNVVPRRAFPVEILEPIIQEAWWSTSEPLQRCNLYRTLMCVNSVVQEIAALRLPLVLSVGSSLDEKLYRTMQVHAATLQSRKAFQLRSRGSPTPEGSAHEPIRSNGPRYYQHIRLELPIHLCDDPGESPFAYRSNVPSDRILGGLWNGDHAFRVVQDLVSDCRSVSVQVHRDGTTFWVVPWALIRTLKSFAALKSVDMDYEDCFPDATISVDYDAVTRSPLTFPSVTSLRLAGRSSEFGTQRSLFQSLATTFPNLRALTVAFSIYLANLDVPAGLVSLTLEVHTRKERVGTLADIGLIQYGIGAALKKGLLAGPPTSADPPSATPSPGTLTVCTGIEVPLWWEETQRICAKYGVRVKKVVVQMH